MDRVVIPAIDASLSSFGRQSFHHTSLKLIRLNGRAASAEALADVPDTSLDFYLHTDQLQSVWENIRQKNESPGFEESRGVSPIILANYSPLQFNEPSSQEAFQKLLQNWNANMDMQHIPPDDFHVDMVAQGDVDIAGR
jgi:hypothetical protein